jgi:hypothetical protein
VYNPSRYDEKKLVKQCKLSCWSINYGSGLWNIEDEAEAENDRERERKRHHGDS